MRKRGIKAALLIGAAALWLSACSGGETAAKETQAAGQAETEANGAASEGETADGQTGDDAAQKAGEEGQAPSTAETEAQEKRGVFEEFEAVDLEGSEVNQDIFKDYDLTMINIWATFCGPCLSEMPELGELSEEYKEKGVQIVGICTDTLNYDGSTNDSQVEEAKAIVEKTGAAYLHIVPEGDLAATLLPQIQVVPTTVFVDKDGKQVGSAVAGARSKEDWAKLLDEMTAE